MDAVTENPLLRNLVPLELAGEIEYWRFNGDAIDVCLRVARRCACREMHYWFINRNGVTRCVGCDYAYLKERQEKVASGPSPAEGGLGVNETAQEAMAK